MQGIWGAEFAQDRPLRQRVMRPLQRCALEPLGRVHLANRLLLASTSLGRPQTRHRFILTPPPPRFRFCAYNIMPNRRRDPFGDNRVGLLAHLGSAELRIARNAVLEIGEFVAVEAVAADRAAQIGQEVAIDRGLGG